MIPLPHISETVEFIKRASSRELRPDGYAVATAHGSKYLGDRAFDPVWEVLNDLWATVFVHPSGTMMPDGLKYPPYILEFPFDTTRCILSVLSSGVLTRFPNIRFLFAHGGGAFPYLVDRCQLLDPSVAANNNLKTIRELLATSNIFFDSAITSHIQWPLIHDLGFPADHIVHGTDFPYTVEIGVSTLGKDAPKRSGVYTKEELEVKIVRENALTNFFPRLKAEYQAVFGG